MPGLMCAVFGCNNNWKFAKANGLSISFHVFPKDKDIQSKTRREQWIWRCKRADNWNPDTSRICSEHFSAEDYERDMQNELLGLPIKKKLKKDAVPTLHLPGSILQIENGGDALTNDNALNESDPLSECDTLSEDDALDEVDALSEGDVSEQDAPSECDIQASAKYNELLEDYRKLKQDYADFRHSSRVKIKLLQNNLNYYKKKYFKQKYNLY